MLNLAIRSLYNASQRVASETYRKRQGEFTTLGFVEQARRKPSLDRVQFQF